MKKYAFFLLLLSQAFLYADTKPSSFQEFLSFAQEQSNELKMLAESNPKIDKEQLEKQYFQVAFTDEARDAAMNEYYNNPTSNLAKKINEQLEAFIMQNLQILMGMQWLKAQISETIPTFVENYNYDIKNVDQISIELVARLKINDKTVDDNEGQPVKIDFSPFLKEAKIKAQAEKLANVLNKEDKN